MLRTEELSKAFGGVAAVDAVSIGIEAGAVHALIGPNGAGKTTLLNLLCGIYRPTRGRILFEGRDLTGRATHEFAAAGIGRTFQNLQVFFNMTALENVMVGRHLLEPCGLAAAALRLPARVREERVCRAEAESLLDFVGLASWRDTPADAMPYGALKRLEIARALGAKPRLLLLDEPAAGLNQSETRSINALIERLTGAGVTVVLVEHNMRLVMGVSDHIVVLDYGRKLCEGTAGEVRNDPRVIEAYLGSAETA
ncbi:MAG: ABC transporter ATP-binding protein [Burkholderiales bacterium]|nr:ABC transporter ATP-binding protein [Burkholderiales bacterium]